VTPPAIPAPLASRPPDSQRAARLRFGFTKTGSLALLSHLDLVRLLERALRRSDVAVSFTGGFHPLPRLQFALALPLGAEARGEWMDLELAAWQPPTWVQQRLQAQLPEGLRLLSVEEVPVSGPSLSQELAAARWSLELRGEDSPEALLTPQLWRQAAAQLLQASSWIWNDTDKKGRPRQRDCRPYLQALEVFELGGDPAGAQLDYSAEIDAAGRSLRPEQLQHWFSERLGQPLQLGRLCRLGLQLREGPATPGERANL
jgi:radical SAM-linked protein